MCCSTSVRQISIASEPHRTFFLKLEWAEDLGSGFVILLSDGISAWSGEVSEEDVSREAQEIEMERERYVGDLHLALTGEGPAAEGEYSFHLTPERPGRPLLQLSYEKVQNDISSRSLLTSYAISSSLSKAIHLQFIFNNELDIVCLIGLPPLHRMQRYVQGKEKLERDLYSRFVLVLNEKKDKLRALQKRVKELEKSADSEDHKAMETEADKSPEESDYGGSTEDEQEAEPRQPDPKPLTQESNPMDDSLNDITDVAPCRKRRHRHLQQLETQAKRAALDQRQRSRYPHSHPQIYTHPLSDYTFYYIFSEIFFDSDKYVSVQFDILLLNIDKKYLIKNEQFCPVFVYVMNFLFLLYY
uniref:X-ray repair complementing defective repair in Chinese hamster cells 4 n=1 Tax=Cyprinus carpio TaxID=7962 RepID=A0A8C1R7J5_CYPCA